MGTSGRGGLVAGGWVTLRLELGQGWSGGKEASLIPGLAKFPTPSCFPQPQSDRKAHFWLANAHQSSRVLVMLRGRVLYVHTVTVSLEQQ